MVDKIRFFLAIIGLVLLICFCSWDLYAFVFYDYIANGIWTRFYKYEPITFILDSLAIPIFILIIYPLTKFFAYKKAHK